MLNLAPDQYDIAAGLLDQAPFNVLMAKAVIERRVQGEVVVDAPDPTTVLAQHKYGMSWLIGYSADPRFRSELISKLTDPEERSKSEWLQVYPLDWTVPLDQLADAGKLTRWNRTNFWFNRSLFVSRFPDAALHPTVPCSQDLVNRFDASVAPDHFWDTTADFLESGIGYFVIEEDEPVALGFSSYLDETHLEIGVETAPRFRGRGYAQAACARTIHHCLTIDLIPVWSCRTENGPSYRLAESLGFVPVLQLPYYQLPHR